MINLVKQHCKQQQTGYAMLIVMILASSLLAITLSISNIVLREIGLTASIRESERAFALADEGIECVKRHDIFNRDDSDPNNNAFVVSSTYVSTYGPIVCRGQDVAAGPEWIHNGQAFSSVTSFRIGPHADGSCTNVTVTKTNPASNLAFPSNTVVESRGWNSCDGSSRFSVERSIRARY